MTQHWLVVMQRYNKASLGNRDLIAETKFDSQAAAAFQGNHTAASAQLHNGQDQQSPEQASARSHTEGLSRESHQRTPGRRNGRESFPSQVQHTSKSSLQRDAESDTGHSLQQRTAGRQEQQLAPSSATKMPAYQASNMQTVSDVAEDKPTDDLSNQASDKDTDRPVGGHEASDRASDRPSTCLAHSDWAVGWVAGGGFEPGLGMPSQSTDKLDAALLKIQQLERELQAARAEIAVMSQGQVCCAVPCCAQALLCCAVLCCAVLCCAVLS